MHADRIEAAFDRYGFGTWAVELPGVSPFIGFIGLAVPRFDAPFMPAVEIGWRLCRAGWGRGYATEGAIAALAFGFEAIGLAEIVSFAWEGNVRSRRVMERIGMHRDPADDFDHPSLGSFNQLRTHILYRVRRDSAAWAAVRDSAARVEWSRHTSL